MNWIDDAICRILLPVHQWCWLRIANAINRKVNRVKAYYAQRRYDEGSDSWVRK